MSKGTFFSDCDPQDDCLYGCDKARGECRGKQVTLKGVDTTDIRSWILFIHLQILGYCLSAYKILDTVRPLTKSWILFVNLQNLGYCLSAYKIFDTVCLLTKSWIKFARLQNLGFCLFAYKILDTVAQSN